jgi:hypothetical protein
MVPLRSGEYAATTNETLGAGLVAREAEAAIAPNVSLTTAPRSA